MTRHDVTNVIWSINFSRYIRPQVAMERMCCYAFIIQWLLMILFPTYTTAIYCNGVETFEKVSGMTMRGASSSPLYMSTGSSVTAECNMRCRASLGCSAYVTNYDMNACFRVDSSSSFERGRHQLVMATERLHYFEKICLQGPVCDRAWSFERVLNHQLMGFDNKLMQNVPTRQRCEEMCLMEKDFPCMSAEFDGSNCRMSKESRRSQPGAFSPAMGVEYMENQCAQPPNEVSGECDFEQMANTDVGHADLQRAATSLQQCQDMCEGSRLFPCRAFSWNVDTNMCRLSADDMFSVSASKMRQPRQGTSFFQRSACLNMSLACSADMMTVTLRTPEPFMGRIYARDEPMLCEAFGNGRMETQISMMLHQSRCGVMEESPGMFSNIVVIQQHPILQRKGDRSVKLMCFFEADNRTVTSGMNVVTDNSGAVDLVNSTAPPPTVRLRIVDINGTDVMGATLGDQLFLRIEIDQDSAYDIFPRDLVTRSGTTDESIVLLDSAGCPTDPNIFPGLTRIPNTRNYEGNFEAFKFSTDAVVRFTVNIQFCLRQCPPPECNGTSTSQPMAGPTKNAAPNHMPGSMHNMRDHMPAGSMISASSEPMPGSMQGPGDGPGAVDGPGAADGPGMGAEGPGSGGADGPVLGVDGPVLGAMDGSGPGAVDGPGRVAVDDPGRGGVDGPSGPGGNDISNGRSKRDIEEGIFEPLVLTELNLQRQLLVNNIDLEQDPLNVEEETSDRNSVIPKDSVCLSSTVLLVSGIGLAMLQVCIVATCAVCLCLHRPRKKEVTSGPMPQPLMFDVKHRGHNNRV